MDREKVAGRKRNIGVVVRFLTVGLVAAVIAMVPVVAATAGAVGSTRGRVTVAVVGVARATGPVCLTLRDLTVNLVVGSYCDGDVSDLNPSLGRIVLDLPRRSFTVDALARGATVESISPRRFDLEARQTVVVRLARSETSRRS